MQYVFYEMCFQNNLLSNLDIYRKISSNICKHKNQKKKKHAHDTRIITLKLPKLSNLCSLKFWHLGNESLKKIDYL